MAACAFLFLTFSLLISFPRFQHISAQQQPTVVADSGRVAAAFMQMEKPSCHSSLCLPYSSVCHFVHSCLHSFIHFLFSGSCELLHRPRLFLLIHYSFSHAYLKSVHTCSLSLVRDAWNYLLLNGLQPLKAAQQGFALFIDFHSFCLNVCAAEAHNKRYEAQGHPAHLNCWRNDLCTERLIDLMLLLGDSSIVSVYDICKHLGN